LRSNDRPARPLIEDTASPVRVRANAFQRQTPGRFNPAVEPENRISGRSKCVAWLVLAVYLSFLLYRAMLHSDGGEATSVPGWQMQGSRWFFAWMGGLALKGLCEFTLFVPVGFISAMVVPRGQGLLSRFAISLPGLVVASVLAALVHVVKMGLSWHVSEVLALTLPVLGCLLGTWMGTTWLRGWLARFLFLPKLALLVLLGALGAGITLWMVVEETPLPFEAARVTSAEKRRLVRLVRGKNPRSLAEGQLHRLRLTDHDINVLLSWGLSIGSPDRKAKVDLGHDYACFSASIGIAPGGRKTRYLNLEVDGNSEVEDNLVRLNIYRCSLGSLKVPRWLLNLLSPAVTALLNEHRLSKPFAKAIEVVQIDPDSIAVTYGRVDLPPGFRQDLFGPATASEEVLTSTRAQVENLLAAVTQIPGKQPSFGMCLETVFALARERSAQRDPVTENRAGIFALGVLLGHHRLEEFLGSVLPDRDYLSARRALLRVTVRRRSDWTKHFCVSAAIAILSDDVSDAAGLLKEELDAGRGGSGFSFADLLADRAGTTFALRATRDQSSARAMQDRLARGFSIEEFFPPAADLPEGIPDAELQSRYGGVGGQAYNRLIDEIERRIAACAAYR